MKTLLYLVRITLDPLGLGFGLGFLLGDDDAMLAAVLKPRRRSAR